MRHIKNSEVAQEYSWEDDAWTIPRREGGIHPAFVPDRAAPRRDEQPIGPTFVLRNDFGSGSSEASRFTIRDDSFSSIIHRAIFKRIFDVLASIVLAIALGPVMIVIAVLIRLESRGPVLFQQERAGFRGGIFRIIKFRTMISDAENRFHALEAFNESTGGVLFKMKVDPRVTRLGRLLRRTSLDELPQLLNVLRGEMSLVGPRPLQLRDCALLKASDAEGYQKRLQARPGLTGLWQVSGRNEVGFEQMIHLDSRYIDRWSIWMELRIVVKTIWVVLTCKGAY